MIQIYRDSARFFVQSALGLVLFAALIEAVPLFIGKSAVGGEIAAQLIMIYAFHRYFLFGETLKLKASWSGKRPKMGLFFLFSGVFLCVILVGVVIVSIQAKDQGTDFAYGAALLWSALASWVMLGVFGTLFPKSIDGNAGYSLAKGIKTAPVTMLRLVLGPFVVFCLFFTAAIPLENALLGTSQSVQFIAMTLLRMTGFFSSILTAGILCASYKRALGLSERDMLDAR
jgi:hypothetical protein